MENNKEIKQIVVKIPKNYMNIAVVDGHLIANTNNSKNWDTIKIPLPEGNWDYIAKMEDGSVILWDERKEVSEPPSFSGYVNTGLSSATVTMTLDEFDRLNRINRELDDPTIKHVYINGSIYFKDASMVADRYEDEIKKLKDENDMLRGRHSPTVHKKGKMFNW